MAFQNIGKDPYFSTNYGGRAIDFVLEYDPTNGKVNLKEKGITSIGTYPIFSDGTFNQSVLDQLNINTNQRNSLYLGIQKDTLNAQRANGGNAKGIVLPSWAQASQQGKQPGAAPAPPGVAPPSATAAIGNIFSPGLNINIDFSDNAKSVYGGITSYPRDILKTSQDTLRITQFTYQPPKGDIFAASNINVGDILKEGLQRGTALKDYIGTVILPIPNGIQDSNNVNWGSDEMNNLTTAATAQVMSTLPQASLGAAAAGALSSFTGIPNVTPYALLATLASQGIASPEVQAQLKTALSSLILKTGGFEVPPETILSRGLGVVPNSNMELLFNGPSLRQFTFAYRMSPRSELEAADVRKIIRFFKQGMAAKKQNSQGGSGARSLFLGTPNVFKLEYKTGNEDIAGLNKFKICAMTGFTVNYAPDGEWAAYDKGQPVSLTINMGFQELEPIYNTDYQETGTLIKSKNGDNSPVKPGDVGY
jgi:hypothetical protein